MKNKLVLRNKSTFRKQTDVPVQKSFKIFFSKVCNIVN